MKKNMFLNIIIYPILQIIKEMYDYQANYLKKIIYLVLYSLKPIKIIFETRGSPELIEHIKNIMYDQDIDRDYSIYVYKNIFRTVDTNYEELSVELLFYAITSYIHLLNYKIL